MRPAVPPEPGQPSPAGLGTPPLTRPGPQVTGASPPRSLRLPAAHLTLRLPRAFKLGPTGRLDASAIPRLACCTPARPSGCRTAPPPQAVVLQWGRCSAVTRPGRGWGPARRLRDSDQDRGSGPGSRTGLRPPPRHPQSKVTLERYITCRSHGPRDPVFPCIRCKPQLLLQPMRAFFA